MNVVLRSGDLTLEGDLIVPAGARRVAVLCHPHPQYGGDMDNPLVCALAAALRQIGVATLRFNFRGVGASEGAYTGGPGEVADACAAVRFAAADVPGTGVTLVGYSFGAMVALQAGAAMAEVERLVAVAPPVRVADLWAALGDCRTPKLCIVGDRDPFCDVAEFRRQFTRLQEPKAARIIAGADHFFGGCQECVAQAVQAFVRPDG